MTDGTLSTKRLEEIRAAVGEDERVANIDIAFLEKQIAAGAPLMPACDSIDDSRSIIRLVGFVRALLAALDDQADRIDQHIREYLRAEAVVEAVRKWSEVTHFQLDYPEIIEALKHHDEATFEEEIER